MQYRELGRTGLKVSVLSLGGAALGQQYGAVSLDNGSACVRRAIEAGVNLIDTSAYYGKGTSERMLGDILADGLRNKVFLCTKAGRFDVDEFDFRPEAIQRSLDDSLRRLKTDFVDILLAHDIEFADDFETAFGATADALHKLKRQGKCRFIGMSGHPLGILRQAIERCDLDVVVSYAHHTLQNRLLIKDLLPIAEQHGVGVLNGSPLCLGALTNQGPPPWHPASSEFKSICRQAAEHCRARGSNISFLGMQFCFREERIASTITGTASAAELETNLLAMNTPIDDRLLNEVEEILEPIRDSSWTSGRWRD